MTSHPQAELGSAMLELPLEVGGLSRAGAGLARVRMGEEPTSSRFLDSGPTLTGRGIQDLWCHLHPG